MEDNSRKVWEALALTGKSHGAYRIEYCIKLIEHMSMGFSYDSFAGKIGVAVTTLKNWESAHPEWVQAKAEGHAARLLHWEGIALGHVTGAVKANPAALIFALKNAFPENYKDKQELDVKGYSNTVRMIDTGISRNAPQIEEERPHTIEMQREEELDL